MWCRNPMAHKYCGVFTPCRNCNIETRSHNYATVDEAVFSPCRAEPRSVVPWRVAHRLVCCQATAINTWMTQEWERVTWPRQQWRHAFQQWRNNWSTVGRSFPRVRSGFIGETEARLRVSSRWEIAAVLSGRHPREVSELWAVSSEDSYSLCVESRC
jgi:hypothetical protein